MKPSIIHSIVVCLAAFALPFMVTCCSQEESLPEVESTLLAVFTLDLGDSEAYGITRATPTDGEYDKGSGLENFIDFPNKDFRCYLFGTDNAFISTLDLFYIYNLGVEGENKYKIHFQLKDTEEVKNALTNGCRFVFLANWGNYPDPTPGMTIEQLCTASAAKFEFSQEKTVLSDNNLIPMYGVKEFESGVPEFKEGKKLSDIGTLYLLRAFAKVDVNINFEGFAETPVVSTSVSLTHSNNKGFKAPADVTKEGQYVTGSWLTDYTPVHIPSDAGDITDLTLTKDENTGHYIAYVPEYRNVDENGNTVDNHSRIKINFTFGDTETAGLTRAEGYIDFCYSDNLPAGATLGQHFDIARNNWYKFNVTAKGKDIVWSVDVIPFTSIDLDPDYGLEREVFTGYVVGKDKNGNKCWYNGNYYDPEKAVPLYLGPINNPGEFVSINGKEYLLVYTDYERTAATLDHFFEMESRKKYLLTPEGITGYKYGNDMYLNKLQQRVWLDSGGDPNGDADAKAIYEALKNVGLELKCCRILYEWDRLNWNQARWWGWSNVYPKYWFDIFGNRYPWSEGDTKDKRRAKLVEKIGVDWIQYLE